MEPMMEFMWEIFDALVHLSPGSVNALAHQVGPSLYVILFAIIFAETGLVATPFLPGDSLLFAVGAIAAKGLLDIWLVAILLMLAAFLGDNSNYFIGKFLGPRILRSQRSKWLNRKHLDHTHAF